MSGAVKGDMTMNVAEIKKRVDAMPARLNAKGLREPVAQFAIEANVPAKGWLSYKDKNTAFGSAYEWFREGSASEILDAMDAWIAALPSAEETKFKEFMSALGGVIDLGKDNGIEVDFLNPLVATMKRLSENAITYQAAA